MPDTRQEVQGAAFTCEQAARRPLKREQRVARADSLPVPAVPFDVHRVIELGKHGIDPGLAAQHAILAGDDASCRQRIGCDQGSSDIAAADILGQGGADVALDDSGIRGDDFRVG